MRFSRADGGTAAGVAGCLEDENKDPNHGIGTKSRRSRDEPYFRHRKNGSNACVAARSRARMRAATVDEHY